LWASFAFSFLARAASIQHTLNLRGVHGAVIAERSDSNNRDIAESG